MEELKNNELCEINGGGFPWGSVTLLLYVVDKVCDGLIQPC